MHSALFTLISFSVFALCTGVCPMSMDMEAPMNNAEHAMHMAHGGMNHDAEIPCERCENHLREQVTVQHASSGNDAPMNAVVFMPFSESLAIHHHVSTIPRPHLTAAGPPALLDMIRTVVLRT